MSYLPPSLRTTPNRNLRDLTDEELLEEYGYYTMMISRATSWGAALAQYDKVRSACRAIMKERGLDP